MTTHKILHEKVTKASYVIRRELVAMAGHPPLEWVMAYTPRGEYIGSLSDARFLCEKRGISPELRQPGHTVCSIGFSTKDGKWYGWSHRAIYGFKIGSTCRKGHCHYIPKNEGGKGVWTAKTMEDARQMACDFAASVS